MWDDENDKRIGDAADHFQPPLDETAWQKMELLLDENLPQKEDRKRIVFFLPFVLILAGFVVFFYLYHNNDGAVQQKFHTNTSGNSNASTQKPNDENITASLDPESNNKKTIATTRNGVRNKKAKIIYENENPSNDFLKTKNQNKIPGQIFVADEEQKEVLHQGNNISMSKPTNSSNSDFADKNNETTNSTKTEAKQPTPEKNIPQVADEMNRPKANQKSVKHKLKDNRNFDNNFSLSFSAGPGMSAVGNKEGKLALDFGVGVGYSFSKHFGVRTGIFISKKIYSATPEQYYLPGGNYNYLEKINANCNVIDIPLNIDYYFNQTRKHVWFVSAGLSSYLMKKESYEYVYKTPAGQTYTKDWAIKNQNQHFLSVLNFSAGYQYFLNQRFSLAVQPYIDLPLTGIGAGKVKLNSAGILFTIKAKPFLKKSK